MTIADLPRREQRGSRARCVLLTEGSRDDVADRLTHIAAPFARIDPDQHVWMPGGFSAPAEAKLGEATRLLSSEHRSLVTDWWLAVRTRANTPNWDIAATATIGDRQGLLLVEAKAHTTELKRAGHGIRNVDNLARIRGAIEEASRALSSRDSEWCLSCDSHYQLANRFAWSWKLASLEIPVVLVYLGFLNAVEMMDQGAPFRTPVAWEEAVRAHAVGVLPDGVWENPIEVAGTPVNAIIRAVELPLA